MRDEEGSELAALSEESDGEQICWKPAIVNFAAYDINCILYSSRKGDKQLK